MAIKLFIGNPPQYIVDWINTHSTPSEPTAPNGKVLYKTSADGEWLESDADITDGTFNGFNEKSSAVAVIIPSKDASGNDVTGIEGGAFEDCEILTNLTIPDSVTSIGDGTFYGCSDSIFDTTTIPGVKLVDGWAVGHTDSLSNNLDLTGIRGIGDGAFSHCTVMTSVIIPDTITNIGDSAFYGCSGLTSVTIPDNVKDIGEWAFYDCSGLTSVTITANGGNAENVKQMVITAINNSTISDNITWNMPS